MGVWQIAAGHAGHQGSQCCCQHTADPSTALGMTPGENPKADSQEPTAKSQEPKASHATSVAPRALSIRSIAIATPTQKNTSIISVSSPSDDSTNEVSRKATNPVRMPVPRAKP